MIITISGFPGSGKSTVGKLLAQQLGFQFVSMGDLRGALVMSKGLTIDQLNQIGEKEDWTDTEIDKKLKKLARKDKMIIDSGTAFHFIPKSFKIFLTVDPMIGAKRVFQHGRRDEKYSSLGETIRALDERMQSDAK